MEKCPCGTCQTPTTLTCGLCNEATCKSCAHLLGDEVFAFVPKPDDHLTKGVYCTVCYQTRVQEAHKSYEQTMEAARNVDVYYKKQGKETRWVKREDRPYEIKDCEDRDELLMRLAFRAALEGYSTLVDVELIGVKKRSGAYQTTIYHGSGAPANARENQIPKDRSLRSSPN